jgi:integrase
MIIKNDWPKLRKPTAKLKYWVVDPRPFYPREYFKTQAEAKDCKLQLKNKANNVGTRQQVNVESLTSTVVHERLKAHGVSLLEVADYWIKQNSVNQKTVSEAVKDWLAFKKKRFESGDIKRDSYTNLASCIRYFREPFGHRLIHTLTREELAKWVDDIGGTALNRYNVRSIAMNLINWCVERGYLRENVLKFKKVEVKRVGEVHILGVDECEDLLAAAKPTQCFAYILLCLFAGLRPEETQRLKWGWFAHGQVHVRESKTGPRYVELKPELWNILTKLRGKDAEKVIPSDFRNMFDYLRADAGWRPNRNLLLHVGAETAKKWKGLKAWGPDCMRHSYASYWLPMHHSYAELASLMGNSERIIKQNYRKAIPKQHAEAFWNLLKTLSTSEVCGPASASAEQSSSRDRCIPAAV